MLPLSKFYTLTLLLSIICLVLLLSVDLSRAVTPPAGIQRDLQKTLQKAGSSNKSIVLTPGDWVVSSNLEVAKNVTLKLQKGARISVATGKALTVKSFFQAPEDHVFVGDGEIIFDSDRKQTVYPQWWGAKGDGLAEDTAALQSAVNSFSLKGGEIFIPRGRYLVNALNVKSNISLKGNGAESILMQKSGAKYCVSTRPASNPIMRDQAGSANISFTDLSFRGTVDTDGFSEFFMLLDIRGTSNVSVSRCNFAGFRGDGIYIGETKIAGKEQHNSNILVSECLFDGINKDNRNGISVIDCDGLRIRKCIFRNCSRSNMPGAIDVEPDARTNIVKNIHITENRFDNIGGNNIIQISITSKLGRIDVPLQNVEIAKNVIEGDGKANGIFIGQDQLADDITIPNLIRISDNVVRNTKRSFMIFGVKDVRIAGNIFEGCDEDPYLSYSQKKINIMDVKITGNTFKDLSRKDGVGISIFGVRNLEFKDNTFDNIGKADRTGGNALFFRRHGGPAEYVTIENNTFKGSNTTVAIQRELGNDTFPEHNSVKNNIYLSSDKVFLPVAGR